MSRTWSAAAGFLVVAIYVLRLNNAAGLMVDDAWYVLLAKALSEGRGYRLISSAAEEIIPSYPPGYPAILSLIFRLQPEFPANVWLLKSVSILAMITAGLLTYTYLHRHRGVARSFAIYASVAITMTPAFVFLATSTLMSECVFTCAQLAGVVLLHRSVQGSRFEVPEPRTWNLEPGTVVAAMVAAGAILIRSAGIALVLAAVLWLIRERRWTRAAVFIATVGICLLPWLLYARSHAPTPEQRAHHGGAVAYGYADQLSMRWAGSPSFGRATAADLPARIGTNIVDIFTRDVGGILVPVAFRGATESGEEVVALGGRAGLTMGSMGGAVETMVISALLSAIALLGFIRKARERLTVAELLVPISLAITVVWPFWSFRFLLPLAPFLFLYLITGLQIVARGSSSVMRVVLLCLLGLHVYDHAAYVWARASDGAGSIQWLADDRRVDAVLLWMRDGLDDESAVATTNPALVYLRTGRKGIAFDDPGTQLESLKARGIRYVASFVPVDPPDRAARDYKVLYSSGDLWVIDLQ